MYGRGASPKIFYRQRKILTAKPYFMVRRFWHFWNLLQIWQVWKDPISRLRTVKIRFRDRVYKSNGYKTINKIINKHKNFKRIWIFGRDLENPSGIRILTVYETILFLSVPENGAVSIPRRLSRNLEHASVPTPHWSRWFRLSFMLRAPRGILPRIIASASWVAALRAAKHQESRRPLASRSWTFS